MSEPYDYRKDPNVALALSELEKRRMTQAAAEYKPFPKQREFHGYDVLERMFSAGNQLGKTHGAAMESAYHALGDYPDWWTGHRFSSSTTGWVGSAAYAAQRDAAQYKLLGTLTPVSTPEQIGTGAFPRDRIVKVIPARGVQDALDTVLVRHRDGGISTVRFKTYDQEIMKWAGGTVNWVWFDEEPPEKHYNEGLMRVSATKGIVYLTYTPLGGMTALTDKFLYHQNQDRKMVVMTAYDEGPKSRAEVDKFLQALPEWEREARIFGRPAAGEGKIIKVAESQYVIEPIELKSYWPRIIGLDFGMLHPTAAVWMAWDRDRNRLIVYDEYRQSDLKINEHVGVLLMRGAGEFPVAWPQDGYQREKGSGESIKDLYKKMGVNMMMQHAQTGIAGESLWSSVTDIIKRLSLGQLAVFNSCHMLRNELMVYHQKNGKIEEVNDDLIAALRYATMQHTRAKVPDGLSPSERAARAGTISKIPPGLDIDPWSSIHSG